MKADRLEALSSQIGADARVSEYVNDVAEYLADGSFLRVVNYHNTSPCNAATLRAELTALRKRSSSTGVTDLDRFFETGTLPFRRPALIPAVYEGWRNHYDVLLPLLEEAGFRGWFFIPAFFPDVPVSEQESFARTHNFRVSAYARYPDGRYAMNWSEIRCIAEKHEICCHTGTHARYDEILSEDALRHEIIDAKHRLEDETGRRVDVFCWNRGEDYHHSHRVADCLHEAGFRYLVSNLKLEKIG